MIDGRNAHILNEIKMVKVINKPELTEEEQRSEAVALAQKKFGNELHNYARSLTRTTHGVDADDVMQVFWLCVLRNATIEEMSKKSALYTRLKSRFIDMIRSRDSYNNRVEAVKTQSWHGKAYEAVDMERFKVEFWLRFRGIEMTDLQQEIIWKHAIEGYDYIELSEMYGIATSTISDWVKKTRKQFTFVSE